jgi:amidohydrolase
MPPFTDQTLLRSLLDGIEQELPRAVELRRRLHAQPELAHGERATAAAVAAELPVDAQRAAGTGLLARIGAEDDAPPAPPAPVVAVRAELDGVPVQERTGASFSATGPAMHACGHDVHMAALVALTRAAHAYAQAHEHEHELPAPLLAVFQPSEEAYPSGAEELARGELAGVPLAAVVSAHIHPELAWGSVALDAGVVNASCDAIEIVVEGEPTHGAYPHHGRDPVLALAATVLALHAEVGRRVDPLAVASLSIGVLSAGSAENVVPATATARGALRAYRASDRDLLRELVEEVAQGTARAHGCRARVELVPGEPALENDAGIVQRARELLGAAGLQLAPAWRSAGSDDFAFLGTLAPLAMAFVGLEGAEGFRGRPLHHPELLVPDAAVGVTARALAVLYVAAASTHHEASRLGS